MLQKLRHALGDLGVKQRKMHRNIRIFVDNIHKYIAYRHSNSKFFLAFTDKSLFFCFTRFNFSTNKLP